MLRPARRADAPALTAIRRDAILSLAPAEMSSEDSRNWADSSADERVHRAIEKNEVWVAERGASAAGWVEVDRGRIEGMYVCPDLSGCGIGSTLLLHAEGLIRSAGHDAVALDASPNALRFYLQRGYRAGAQRAGDKGRSMRKPLRGTAQEGDEDGLE